MKKTLVILPVFIIIVSVFCSCGILDFGNKSNEKKLSEGEIKNIKENMEFMKVSVGLKAHTLNASTVNLRYMIDSGKYSYSTMDNQFNDCCDICKELLQEIEEMVDYYKEYPDLFKSIKSAIDSLSEIHDNFGIKAYQGNDKYSLTPENMLEFSIDIGSWVKRYDSVFEGLSS